MKKMFNYFIILILSLITVYISEARLISDNEIKLENVRYKYVSGKMLIWYDLKGDNDKAYTVKLSYARISDSSSIGIEKNIYGKIGDGIVIANNQQIEWDITKENRQAIIGNDLFFIVEVFETLKPKSNIIYYLGGGAAILGGGAYLLFSKKASTTTPNSNDYPLPPGRGGLTNQ